MKRFLPDLGFAALTGLLIMLPVLAVGALMIGPAGMSFLLERTPVAEALTPVLGGLDLAGWGFVLVSAILPALWTLAMSAIAARVISAKHIS